LNIIEISLILSVLLGGIAGGGYLGVLLLGKVDDYENRKALERVNN
jgi:hypothetical protein